MQDIDTSAPAPESLRQLDPSTLPVGSVLPAAIYDANGDVLLRAGWKLRSGDVTALVRRAELGLYGGREWSSNCVIKEPPPPPEEKPKPKPRKRGSRWTQPENESSPKSGLKALSLDSINPGSVLACGLHSERGILLLAEGLEVTPQFLNRLRQHGIFEVHVDSAVHEQLTSASTSGTPRSIARSNAPRTATSKQRSTTTLKDLDRIARTRDYRELTLKNQHELRPRLALDDFREEERKGKELYQSTVGQVSDLLVDMSTGRRADVSELRQLLNQFVGMSALDGALLPCIVDLQNDPDDYLFQHSVNVSLLSMTAAAGQGLPPDDVREIGLGAMLQDVGMLQLPEALRQAPRSLTDKERELIKQHPFYSVAALEKCDGVSGISMMIAYQSHERPNRTGYPRGHHKMFIHPYARIVAAADAFDAVCSNRPYRQAMSPYKGMEFLLRECQKGHFDREVVLSFLNCVSLFPVGTYVQLSDGRSAKVHRSNYGMHTRPVVIPLDAHGNETDMQLDLSTVSDLEVVEAYREPPLITSA